MRRLKAGPLALVIAAAVLIAAVGSTFLANDVSGTVEDGSERLVVGATVYLVPARDVARLARHPSVDIHKDVPNDEPMEDSLAANRDTYQRGTTDERGTFLIPKVADGNYFVYVEPADPDHLPGGDLADVATSAKELAARPLTIHVSGKSPANATFVGSTRCLGCHEDYGDVKKTLHKLGIAVVGKPGRLQDHSRFPGFFAGLDKLMAGKTFSFSAYDGTRGFDKYEVSEEAPADLASLSFTATFFRDPDGTLKFRTENRDDPADPPRTYTVEMTYGGGLYKQRYLYRAEGGLFPFLQFNSEGSWDYPDRTRKPWRDYHADWLYDEAAGKLTDPPQMKSFEIECASCHFNGYSLTPTVAGGFIAGAANDPNGEADIDGDGVPNELNIGCEVCHGPGSVHATTNNARKASTIVNPRKLAAERATVICLQCHSRPQGNLKNEQPVSKENRMLTPGISRNEYLVNHTTREDADQKDFWGDGVHSRTHHQQGTDLIRSPKYINGTYLMTCFDCHDPHGTTGVEHQLQSKVRDDANSLCASCHKDVAIREHTDQTVGAPHEKIHCVDCHSTKTMQSGAGRGRGLTRKDGRSYWMNDITSHIFDVPRKDNPAVQGVDPEKAMPIPYTNACGISCHDVEAL